ncbi:hypothetical protein [Streptomyces sp. NPDC056883]|uniref:hypothetical protein n=1 Tax=Streptomyces sp. NPDC056883 TaxID=3345959 RepID=UPI0036996728
MAGGPAAGHLVPVDGPDDAAQPAPAARLAPRPGQEEDDEAAADLRKLMPVVGRVRRISVGSDVSVTSSHSVVCDIAVSRFSRVVVEMGRTEMTTPGSADGIAEYISIHRHGGATQFVWEEDGTDGISAAALVEESARDLCSLLTGQGLPYPASAPRFRGMPASGIEEGRLLPTGCTGY